MQKSAMASSSADLPQGISEADKILYSIERILDQMSPRNIHVLGGQIINAGIASADILQGVTGLIFEKAVRETTFCPMYAKLCCILDTKLPWFSSGEPDGKRISFRKILLNHCQQTFEDYDGLQDEIKQVTAKESQRRGMERITKFRAMGNIRLIGELFKQKIIPEKIVHHCIQELLGDAKIVPHEEHLEILCELLKIVGKQLEENPKSRIVNDSYFARLKELSHQNLPSGVSLMVGDVLHLRANKWIPQKGEVVSKWIPQKKEVEAKTPDMYMHIQMSLKIHCEAEGKSGRRLETTNRALKKTTHGRVEGCKASFNARK